jgi:uncharacterized Zn-binding protein involved in type VI secretion
MIIRDTAVIDISTITGGGHLVGNGAHTVTLYGHPVALEGSISSTGHAVLPPEDDHQVYIEGRKTARTGNAMGNGQRIQDTVPKKT